MRLHVAADLIDYDVPIPTCLCLPQLPVVLRATLPAAQPLVRLPVLLAPAQHAGRSAPPPLLSFLLAAPLPPYAHIGPSR